MFTLAPRAGVTLWSEADIVVESLTSGDRKILRQGGGMDARYVPTGHLVYVYQNVLYAVPFDVSSPAVKAAAVQVRDAEPQDRYKRLIDLIEVMVAPTAATETSQ